MEGWIEGDQDRGQRDRKEGKDKAFDIHDFLFKLNTNKNITLPDPILTDAVTRTPPSLARHQFHHFDLLPLFFYHTRQSKKQG